ncbi:reverse transcriptase domain-containing protein [Bacillus sp. Fil]|uniref:reverse transcriptase domain-containing protein n=1 Tax=Bacillus sp. Fil TaxID=3459567 RepID=UPI00403AC7A9
MRNPAVVLNNLASKSKDESYIYKRLYRNFFNEELFLLAYARLSSKEGNMTKGTDEQTIDGMSLKRIRELIENLKSEQYQPKPSRRVYIPKKNGEKRPLGIPSFDDKLVQEVMRLILEAMYEKSFSEYSHGFRTNRSCHTALGQIQKRYRGVTWFVEGDIKSFFDKINHHILIKTLRKRINDERFLRLVWKFLRAGYADKWTYHKTYSGSPQGGIISPILSNIYLNEFDKYMEEIIQRFDRGKSRRRNPAYYKIQRKIMNTRDKIKRRSLDNPERKELIKLLKEYRKESFNIPSVDPMDTNFRRLRYTRYCDDFIIGIIGTKQEAQQTKEEISRFLKDKMKIELSERKTLITHSSKCANFLGYNITISRDESIKKEKRGFTKRTYSRGVRLLVPQKVWVEKLKKLNALKINKDGKWRAVHRNALIRISDLEILETYNSEIRGLYNYYCLAENACQVYYFAHFMKYSLYKTFAGKYKTTMKKIINKYTKNGKFIVSYETKKGPKKATLIDKGFVRKKHTIKNKEIDIQPNTLMYSARTELVERLMANKCEWCGIQDIPMEIHHIRKLKDLKGKMAWEKVMIARKRKTMVLCLECHNNLHNGKLD